MDNNCRFTLFFFNPNIYPEEEYLIRKTEIKRYAQQLGIPFIDGDYDHSDWLENIKGMEAEPERGQRCLTCFRIRMLRTAQKAEEEGYDMIATTLASSRWKSLEQISEAGNWATEQVPSVSFLERNWRRGGLSERRIALLKEHNFYNQPYCGCEFSRPQVNKQ